MAFQSTSLTVTSVPPDTGTLDVTVNTAGGTSALVLADRFTYFRALGATTTSLPRGNGGCAVRQRCPAGPRWHAALHWLLAAANIPPLAGPSVDSVTGW